MKKSKRIMAIIGVILLVALYGSTLLFAFIDHTKTLGLFKASVAATIFVPVILYAYSMFYKLSKKEQSDTEE